MAPTFSIFYHIFVSSLPIIIIAQDTILTAEYGNQNGNSYSTLNQGRISQINNWGVDLTGIHLRDWKSDLQTKYDEIYGYGWYHQSCNPFNLSTTDYINGYKIYADSITYYVDDEDEGEEINMEIIRGLVFYTSNGDSYSCIEDASVQSYTDTFTDYYLSGWNIYSKQVLNSIQFQFTHLNATIPTDNDDNDGDDGSTPTPSSTNAIPTIYSTNDDDDINESMETKDDFIFSSTVNSQSESNENPTETKYAQSQDDDSSESQSPSPSSTSSSSHSEDNISESEEINISQTKTTMNTGIQIDENPNQSTTEIIHSVRQDNDPNELKKKGFQQFFSGEGGTVVVTVTMLILIFTLILCCVLTLCVINIKRKKRQREANQNGNDNDNEHENENDKENGNENEVDNDLKLTIPTNRVGERGTGHSHGITISVDGIDGMDGNDTAIDGNGNVVAENVRNIDISNLLSPRYGRRSTDDGSQWPISPIPVMNKGKKAKRRVYPLDHPYSIDWNEPKMLKLTDKMANLFNEEANKGSFISTVHSVKGNGKSSRKPSQKPGSGDSHGHGSETDDAETDNDTDLMYNNENMGALEEDKVTPMDETKGGDDDEDEDNETESESESESESEDDDNDGKSPFDFVPRRNALKLLNVRSNTFGH